MLMSNLQRELARVRRQLANATNDLQSIEVAMAEKKPVQDEPSPYVFEEELMEVFGVSLHTLRRWRKAGKLHPFHQKGRRVFWMRTDLPRLVKAGSEAAAQD